MKPQSELNITEIVNLLQPESDLEHRIIQDQEWREGLFWGKPRWGHPEGAVLFHIQEVLGNIDKLSVQANTRAQLRIIAFIHDTFKHREHRGYPRDWNRHHAVLARQFAERYTDDKELLDVIELHDEAYYAWREGKHKKNKESKARLEKLLNRLNGSRQLYYLFFKCDTQTGDKTQLPVSWFERTIEGIDIVNF